MDRILLLYTSHRQDIEYEISSRYFNRSRFLRENADVYISCNNQALREHMVTRVSQIFDTNTSIHISSKNAGYLPGPSEAIDEVINTTDVVSNYSWIVHLHPDIYLVNTDQLEETLNKASNHLMINDYIDPTAIFQDFFIFKPSVNIWFDWRNQWAADPKLVPERFMYANFKSKYGLEALCKINRRGATDHILDDFGLLHSHDITQSLSYLND